MYLNKNLLLTYISLIWISFQTYIIFFPSQPLLERPIHLILALFTLLFLDFYKKKKNISFIIFFLILSFACYHFLNFDRLSSRMETVDEVFKIDIFFGIILIVLLLYYVFIFVGRSLFLVILFFLFYSIFGYLFPSWTNFRGFDVSELIEILTLTTRGIFGITTQTSLYFVFYFIIFGGFYSAIGGSNFLVRVGLFFSRNSFGGSAKSAIISSSLMGSITGSAVANVSSTGIFTIPLMKKGGYKSEHAASIEAIASTGGQLMPPVMGVAAFVMAEIMMVDYFEIVKSAIVPAFFFYIALFLSIHVNSKKMNIGYIDDKINLNFKDEFKLLIPLAILVILLLNRFSPPYCAMWGVVSCIVVNFFDKKKLTFKEYLLAISSSCVQAAKVAVPIAAIGIVVAICIQSNIALKFSSTLISVSNNSIWLNLLVVIIGCLIMGMGLPTVAAYVIGAVFFVPTLKELGFSEMSSNFFVMYYCVLSMLTPPVALASYTAAGIASANNFDTSIEAFKKSFVIFLIPLCFLFNDNILLTNFNIYDFFISLVGLIIVTFSWVYFLEGYIQKRINFLIRFIFFVILLAIIFSKFNSLVIFISTILFLIIFFLNIQLKKLKFFKS